MTETDEGQNRARNDREQGDQQGEQEQGGQPREGHLDARQVVERAVEYMSEMTGQEPEVVTAVEPDDGGWHVEMELLELARIPQTTDVLGSYEVDLNAEGEPQGYHRTRRYHRGHVGAQ